MGLLKVTTGRLRYISPNEEKEFTLSAQRSPSGKEAQLRPWHICAWPDLPGPPGWGSVPRRPTVGAGTQWLRVLRQRINLTVCSVSLDYSQIEALSVPTLGDSEGLEETWIKLTDLRNHQRPWVCDVLPTLVAQEFPDASALLSLVTKLSPGSTSAYAC